jgi:hypothetical protein
LTYLGGKIDRIRVVFIAKRLDITQDSVLKIKKEDLQVETIMITDLDTIIEMTVIDSIDRDRSTEVGIMIVTVIRETTEIWMSVIDVDRNIDVIEDHQPHDLTLAVDPLPAVGTTAQSLDLGVMIVGMAMKTTKGDTMSVKTGVDSADAKDIVMSLGEGEKAHTPDPILALLVDDMDTYTILLRLVCLVLKGS